MNLVGFELSGMAYDMTKEYKIMGVPLSATYTDQIYRQFKHVGVELLKLKPPADKKNLRDSLFSRPCSFSSNEIKGGG